MTLKQIRIVRQWEIIDSDYPELSTEQLMHRVCIVCAIDENEVAEALEADAIAKERTE